MIEGKLQDIVNHLKSKTLKVKDEKQRNESQEILKNFEILYDNDDISKVRKYLMSKRDEFRRQNK